MAKRPSAKWTGVIAVPELGLSLDGGLYTAVGRRRPLPFLQVHSQCQTALPATGSAEQTAGPVDSSGLEGGHSEQSLAEPMTQTTRQMHCPHCRRAIRADEVEYAVEVPSLGRIRVTVAERTSLRPVRARTVNAQVVQDPSDVLATVGTGRRLYVFPKAESVIPYYTLLECLLRARRVLFIPEIVVDRRPYVVVIRPVTTHPAAFRRSSRLLVADELMDTSVLKDPEEYQLLPAEEPVVRGGDALAVRASGILRMIDLTECANPEQRRFATFVQEKVAQALGQRRVLA